MCMCISKEPSTLLSTQMALNSVFYGEMGEECYELRDNGKSNYSLVRDRGIEI